MCNKICASFLLLSSSGERSAAGRCAGRAGSPVGAPRETGQPQKRAGGITPQLSGAREGPKGSCALPWLPTCRKSPGAGAFPWPFITCLLALAQRGQCPAGAHAGGASACPEVVSSQRGAIGVSRCLSVRGVTVCGTSLLGLPRALAALAPGAQGPFGRAATGVSWLSPPLGRVFHPAGRG